MKIYNHINEDKYSLDESLITFNNSDKFNQVVIIMGGGGSGKGFVQGRSTNLPDSYTAFDVDEVKKSVLKLHSKLKKSYGRDTYPEIQHIIDAGPDAMLNPDNVSFLHKFIKDNKLDKKFINDRITKMLSVSAPDRKPNLLFDKTGRKLSELNKVFEFVNGLGYKPENVHILWVFTSFKLAVQRNAKRERKVDYNILLATHEGASSTMHGMLTQANKQISPSLMNGQIYIVNHTKTTEYEIDVSAEYIKSLSPEKDEKEINNMMKNAKNIIIKKLKYVKIKETGKPISKLKEVRNQMFAWFKENAPSTISKLLNITDIKKV